MKNIYQADILSNTKKQIKNDFLNYISIYRSNLTDVLIFCT